jgi:hypothetical protein
MKTADFKFNIWNRGLKLNRIVAVQECDATMMIEEQMQGTK